MINTDMIDSIEAYIEDLPQEEKDLWEYAVNSYLEQTLEHLKAVTIMPESIHSTAIEQLQKIKGSCELGIITFNKLIEKINKKLSKV